MHADGLLAPVADVGGVSSGGDLAAPEITEVTSTTVATTVAGIVVATTMMIAMVPAAGV